MFIKSPFQSLNHSFDPKHGQRTIVVGAHKSTLRLPSKEHIFHCPVTHRSHSASIVISQNNPDFQGESIDGDSRYLSSRFFTG
jgi:hypothetical protein